MPFGDFSLRSAIDSLFPPRPAERRLHDANDDALAALLEPGCVQAADAEALYLLPYRRETVTECVLEAKFHGNARAAELLGRALHEFLLEFLAGSAPISSHPPSLVPIPLSRARMRERGYNQVERIVRSGAFPAEYARLRIDLLARTRATAPQTSLSGDARRKNLMDAFECTAPCDPDHTYIVVDDVVTTGSTLMAARDALARAGAQRLVLLALAH